MEWIQANWQAIVTAIGVTIVLLRAYQSKTLGELMGKLIGFLAALFEGELESVTRRLKNELANIEDIERSYRAEQKRQAYYKEKPQPCEPGQSNTGVHQC